MQNLAAPVYTGFLCEYGDSQLIICAADAVVELCETNDEEQERRSSPRCAKHTPVLVGGETFDIYLLPQGTYAEAANGAY